jgi:hypothetical protein
MGCHKIPGNKVTCFMGQEMLHANKVSEQVNDKKYLICVTSV